MEKYVFTGESKWSSSGHHLHQIQAVRDLPSLSVKAGDIGGWIENKYNLSQSGDCWVFPDAQVYGEAFVYENAGIYDESTVSGWAKVYGNAKICKNAEIYGYVDISGNACVIGPIRLFRGFKITGDAIVNEALDGCPIRF